MKNKNPWKKLRAREMRKNPTHTEALIWERIRSKKTGYKFRRQAIIRGWIIDFYCPSKKIAVELDGKGHDPKKDAFRDKNLLSIGIKTLRIRSIRVFYNPDEVVETIEDFIRAEGKK